MKKLMIAVLVSTIFTLGGGAPAMAAKPITQAPSNATPLGIDVSYPQCGKTLPTNHAFGIVGVNGGLATTTNPCMAEQLKWADKALGTTSQDKVQLYVNTANPGGLNTGSWPKSDVDSAGVSQVNPYGVCDGRDSLGCAWMYGWNRALEDDTDRFQPAANQAGLSTQAVDYVWWLDVETENTWKTTTNEFSSRSNVAVLEGMTAYFGSVNARVGLYSTAYQWNTIVGSSVTPDSNLKGLPNWRPGGASLKTAKDACNATPLTANGTVVLTQFVSKGLDYNYVCGT
ncbi:MAG: hypothetical protein ABIR46_01585 [Candidatus Saccharimonadales bacterium]